MIYIRHISIINILMQLYRHFDIDIKEYIQIKI